MVSFSDNVLLNMTPKYDSVVIDVLNVLPAKTTMYHQYRNIGKHNNGHMLQINNNEGTVISN